MERFSDKVKNIVVNPNGGEYSDESISKYFEDVKFGDIHTPAVIMDCHGNIMAWHLPGALTTSRTVRIFSASMFLLFLI